MKAEQGTDINNTTRPNLVIPCFKRIVQVDNIVYCRGSSKQLGSWRPGNPGQLVLAANTSLEELQGGGGGGGVLRVVTVLQPPYMMYNQTTGEGM